jgi:serine phosphatase RsbU (regulator of sigma subunit)
MDRFTSCLYMEYETTGRLRYAAAGHPPPLLLAGRRTRFLPLEPGPPLGVSRSSAADHEAELPPGSGLLMFTDGLVEHRSRDLEVRLAALRQLCAALPLASLGDPRHAIDHALGLLDDPGRVDDDTAVLAVVPLTRATRPR